MRIIRDSIAALAREDLLEELSIDESKAIYNYIQTLRILVTILVAFSITLMLCWNELIAPESQLLRWTQEHRTIVATIPSIFIFMPAWILNIMLTPLSTVTNFFSEKLCLKFFSEDNMVFLQILTFSTPMFMVGFVYIMVYKT